MGNTKIVPFNILFKQIEKGGENLIHRLKNLGVNPAGNAKDKLIIGGKSIKWDEMFNFDSNNEDESLWEPKLSGERILHYR